VTLWTVLLIALSGMLLTALLVWVVPVLVVLEGEIRGEQRRGTLSAGLLMGLLGIHASFDEAGLRLRLLLFRRPSFLLPGRAGSRREAGGERQEAEGRRQEAEETPRAGRPTPEVQDQTRDSETGRESRVQGPGSGPMTQDSGPFDSAQGRLRTQDSERPGRAGVMERLRTARGYVRRFRGPAMRFLRTLRGAFRLRRATGDLVFGTGDPATTGQLAGVVYAIRPLLGARVRVDVSPNFLTRTFEAQGSLAVSVSLARVTYAVARLAVVVGGMLGWQYVRQRWAGWVGRRRQAVPYSV